jgi:hypothetical protein
MLNFYKNQKIEISTQIKKSMSDIYSILPDRVWYQLGEDIDGDVSGDNFGRSVSINSLGNRVIIGGNMYDSETGDIIVLGAIYVYNSNLGYHVDDVSVYSLSGNSGSGYQ